MSHTCSYINCNNNSRETSMFSFPWKNAKILPVWLKNCGNERIAHLPLSKLKSRYVCMEHFDVKKHVRNLHGRRKRLVRSAVPIPYDVPRKDELLRTLLKSPDSVWDETMNTELFEIFRACRLCGVGAGYKMPIVQSVVVVHDDDDDTELRQKIMECVQIEVNIDDKMPPLICELCVDKIQDFYKFRKRCQETDRKTRHRLGLPQKVRTQKTVQDNAIHISDDGDPPATQTKKPAKVRKETVVKIKEETQSYSERSSSPCVSEISTSSDRRITRQKRSSDLSLSELQDGHSLLTTTRSREVSLEAPPVKKTRTNETPKTDKASKSAKPSKESIPAQPQKASPKAGPKSKKLALTQTKVQDAEIPLEKSKKSELATPKAKNNKVEDEVTTVRSEEPKPTSEVSMKQYRPAPKSRKQAHSPTPAPEKNDSSKTASKKKRDESPAPKSKKPREQSPKVDVLNGNTCIVCHLKCKTSQGLNSHYKTHDVTYTAPELACNACEQWFVAAATANAHAARHRAGLPYTCSRCYDDFKTPDDYEMHFTRKLCVESFEVPDVKCEECWKTFPTYKLLEEHRCPGEVGRPGGKCSKCRRSYAYLRSLLVHESRCNVKRKAVPESKPTVDCDMLPMEVRIVRCDQILTPSEDGHYHVKGLSSKFGLDRRRTYPYLSMQVDIESEPTTSFEPMVTINDEIKQEYLTDTTTEKSFVHWDSEDTDSDDDPASGEPVRTLSDISLRTLFSPKCLGKVPKKSRKAETDKDDTEFNLGSKIDLKKSFSNIIDSVGNNSNHSGDYDSDSILDKGGKMSETGAVFESPKESVTNDAVKLVNESTTNEEHAIESGNSVDGLNILGGNGCQKENNVVSEEHVQHKNDDGKLLNKDVSVTEHLITETDSSTHDDNTEQTEAVADCHKPMEGDDHTMKSIETGRSNFSLCSSPDVTLQNHVSSLTDNIKEEQCESPSLFNEVTEQNDSVAGENSNNSGDKNEAQNTNIGHEHTTSREGETNSNNSDENVLADDIIVDRNIENVDKFNINNLNEEDRQLMDELNEQIGENFHCNENEDKNINKNNGKNELENGENRYDNIYENVNNEVNNENVDTVGGNSDENSITTENLTNDGDFTSIKVKNENLDTLLNKHDDLKCLDLDKISDDEFNFDL